MVKKRSVFDINFDLDEEEDAGFPAGNAPADPPVVKEYNIQGHPLHSVSQASQDRGLNFAQERISATGFVQPAYGMPSWRAYLLMV